MVELWVKKFRPCQKTVKPQSKMKKYKKNIDFRGKCKKVSILTEKFFFLTENGKIG